MSKMKHYLLGGHVLDGSRGHPPAFWKTVGEIDQQTTKRQCVLLQALLTVSAEGTSRRHYEAVRWGNRPGKARSYRRKRCTAMRETRRRPHRPLPRSDAEGEVGNLPGTSKQQLRTSIRVDVQRTRPSGPVDRCVSSSRSALGTAVNPSYPRPWTNRITRWRANPGSLGKIGHRSETGAR